MDSFETPHRLTLDEQLCFALYAATNAVTRAYRPLLREIGLTYPQYLVMLALWQFGPQAMHEIAERLDLPANALSPLVERLEAAGLIKRHRNDADRRVVEVMLTEAGAQLELAASGVQARVVCATGMQPDELAKLRGELRDLTARLSSAEPDALLALEAAPVCV